jgi:transketolase
MQALEALAERDASICMVATDSRGSAAASGFAQKFPDRFIEAGIAEQNAVGIASGLASTGRTVFVVSPASFLSARSYEQLKVDVAYNRSNVKAVGVSAGVSYGPLGGTHTALGDIAALRALPNIEVFAPSDAAQARAIAQYLARSAGPAYVRIGRGDVEAVYGEGEAFDMRGAKLVRDGSDLTIVACGEMVWHAKQAAALLAGEGVSARVLDMFRIKPADSAAVARAARETGRIVTVEEHSVHGGLGELVCAIAARSCPVPVRVLGFPDEECKVGKSGELFRHYGLDAQGIAGAALECLGGRAGCAG